MLRALKLQSGMPAYDSEEVQEAARRVRDAVRLATDLIEQLETQV